MAPVVEVVVFPNKSDASKAVKCCKANGISAVAGSNGLLGVGCPGDAKKAAALLKKKGLYPVIEKTKNGVAVKWYSTIKQMLSGYLINEIKNDPNIDTSDMKIESNFNSDMVATDVNIAKAQASNIKFSFIDNKIANKTKLDGVKDYQINDLNKMNDYFDMIEQDQMTSITQVNSNNKTTQVTNSNNVTQVTDNNSTQVDDYKSTNDHEFATIEKWWLDQTAKLRSEIQTQFINFPEEFELVSINLLFNSQHAMKFMKHDNCEQSILMFHGTNNKVLNSIFQNGFVLNKGKSIGKLYGMGHYVTPQILHAMRYMQLKYRNNALKAYTLIAAFVNPGKVKHINSTRYHDKDISTRYDSHHCQVTDGMNGVYLGHPVYGGYNGDIMDEYAIRDSTRVLPRFYITLRRVEKVFIWRDKNIANKFNGGVLKELKSAEYPGSVYGVMDTKTAIDLIKRKMDKNTVYVITNGANNGRGFVDKVRNELRLTTDILVFCCAVEWHSKWAKSYQNVSVKCGKSQIVNFVKSKYINQ